MHVKSNFKVNLHPLFFLIIFLLGVSACNDDDDNNTIPGSDISQQDSSFVINGGMTNLAEIQMGELALERGSSDSVLSYAQSMISEHTTAQNELRTIATTKGLSVPDELDAKHRATADSLAALSGAVFDSAYIRSQVIGHQEAQQIFQTQVNQGQDTALTNYASKTLEHVNMHLQRANIIYNTMMNTP